MTAKDQIAAMLNELMGPGRNQDKNLDLNFRDPNVCKFFLAGFCPHDEFVNTKADLGACKFIHDENLRIAYRKSDQFEKLGYERQFFRFLQRVDDDMKRKIERNKERLALTQGAQHMDESTKKNLMGKMDRLESEMAEYVELAEKAGLKGDLDRSQKYVKRAEEVNQELDSVRKLLDPQPPPPEYNTGYKDPNAPKPMRICDVCGSFLIIGDSQQRIIDHMEGRQHLGFSRIASAIQEMKEKYRDLTPERGRHSRSRSPLRSRSRSREDRAKSQKSDSSHKGSSHHHSHRSKRSPAREERDRRRHSRSPHHHYHKNNNRR